MNRFFVTVIVPTLHERKHFSEKCLDNFYAQDYKERELLFDFEEGTIGAKRNRLCERARGSIIVHMDDDDWYAPDWISRSVTALIENRAAITGLRTLNFVETINRRAYLYEYPKNGIPWVAGATMCYWRSFWDTNRFTDKQIGEDWEFSVRTSNIFDHGYTDGFVASIHDRNTSRREMDSNKLFSRLSEEESEIIAARYFGSQLVRP